MARRYTLAEMKSMAEGHFFDRKTMKFFKGDTYGTRYDSETGKNYLYTLKDGKRSHGIAWWHFDPTTGRMHPLGGHTPDGVREV